MPIFGPARIALLLVIHLLLGFYERRHLRFCDDVLWCAGSWGSGAYRM
jgi:hypothetical protein